MQITWVNDKIRKQCEDANFLIKKYDKKLAKKLSQRLVELDDVDNYSKLPASSGKHSIKQGKKLLYFAVDLPTVRGKRGKYRLTFLPVGKFDLANQTTINSIEILGIRDYHK